jgi:tRNA-specific 2-thiouridylase
MCNREMKFGVFLDYALEQGFEAVGTGHYVRRRERPDGSAELWRGADPNKDQSYFLAMLSQEQVSRGRFPVGEMLKPEVRAAAVRFGLPTAGKKDSQGICFIGNIKMSDFLSHYVEDRPGEIVDPAGRVLGEHRGLHLYTLGQRKGHGIASPREGVAYVVVGKEPASNRLVVGYDLGETPGLYATRAIVGSVSAIGAGLGEPRDLLAQARYRAGGEAARIEGWAPGKLLVTFARPQRALTPGQICAFYDAGRLLGGGVFEQVGVAGG